MSLKLLSTKLIGGITVCGGTIVGGGFGINAAVNGGGSANSNTEVDKQEGGGGILSEDNHLTNKVDGVDKEVNRDVYEYHIPESASPQVKTYLKDKSNFAASWKEKSNFMLVKVDTTTEDTDLSNESLTCHYKTGNNYKRGSVDCKLHLIKSNLTNKNIGSLLYSLLTKIKNTTTDSPKDSYVLLEVVGSQDDFENMQNNEIHVHTLSSSNMIVNIDQVLYKKTVTIGSQSVDVIVPVRKNIVTFLATSTTAKSLFNHNATETSFNCFYKKERTTINKRYFDDSCKIIKIDTPTENEKKLTSFEEFKNSKKPLTKEHFNGQNLSLFKLEVDINKFYDSDGNILNSDLKIEITPHTKDGPKSIFTINNGFTESNISGTVKWYVVKYKGDDATINLSNTNSLCYFKNQSVSTASCRLFSITPEQLTTKEDFQKITIANNYIKTNTQLKKDTFYVIKSTLGQKENTSKLNTEINFQNTVSGNSTIYKFEKIALLASSTDVKPLPIFITDIGNI